ncbi:MAG: glycosyltransferase family 4 protein [Gemmatimonadales bacterium]|nr:glycosyltransferase family 4 protein [Gemmatimonadales bacterium]
MTAPASRRPLAPRAVEPLRLLFVSHSFPLPGRPLSNVGGMQRIAQDFLAALRRHPGAAVETLLLETSWEATHRRAVPFFARLLREIPARAGDGRAAVVLHSSLVTASTAVVLAGRVRRAGARTAAIAIGRDLTLPVAPYQWFVPRVMRALDAIFPISDATAAECLARGADPGRLQVIPCGVDTTRFAPPPDRAAARAALLARLGGAVPDGSFVLCSVGRHYERKGFHWFVEAVLPMLPPDVHLVLAGEGPLTPAIRAAAARAGVSGRLHLPGQAPAETIQALYAGADLFVMPNLAVPGDIEGFGVVMLEAGASGLPVVGADLEGIATAIREGENGTLVPSGDAAAFAARILAFRDDRAALASASARGAAFVARTYAWDAIADSFVRALAERPAPAARVPAPT